MSKKKPKEPTCSYCGRKCVGVEHSAYPTLHFLDPLEVAKRDQEATAVMRKMVRYGNPY
jgi:hypothetical protein